MQKARTEIARILTQMFPSETFKPENIHQNRLNPNETRNPGAIRWWAESDNRTLIHTTGLTMTDFIKTDPSQITRTHDKNLGWQLHPES